MSRICLFVINGLGMGNSTRCYSVIEHLAEAGCVIHVLTSGNGVAYFQDKPGIASITPMESFFYSGRDGRISGWSTFKSIAALLRLAKAKKTQLDTLLEQIHPDIAVVDSEYVLSPLRQRGIPIIALNTSEMIVTEYLKRRREARGVSSHFWFVEFSDYIFHRHFCDLVLSPFPLRTPTRNPKFRRIGLIARRSVLQKACRECDFPSPRQLRTVVFMLSGSVHASNVSFEGPAPPFKIEVVGRQGLSRGNVIFHGRIMDNTELLARADALVINGGYSAISEAFVLRKPVFVIPVPGHAEQFVNASLVRDLGLGFVATEENVLAQLFGMYQEDKWFELKAGPKQFQIDGAREACEAITSYQRPVHHNPKAVISQMFGTKGRQGSRA